mmetsp:Transcript_12814/g.22875  ORF Transcript_12814/g.22875 Transcript_12814/m.22875 type:complete len:220 (-) Transcript_12814:163-822(-)
MDEVKAQLKEMMGKRDVIEAEINERSERLNAPGMPGLKGPLVDKEGFPFANVDVFQVRTDRNRLAALYNDHKAITSEMEQAMHQLHALAREAGPQVGSSSGGSSNTARPSNQPASSTGQAAAAPSALPPQPFAVVDEVSDGSPASEAGIKVGDELCAFGEVVWNTERAELQQIAAMIKGFENRELPTKVLRGGTVLLLVLTPKQWSGRGLLGCHLVPKK